MLKTLLDRAPLLTLTLALALPTVGLACQEELPPPAATWIPAASPGAPLFPERALSTRSPATPVPVTRSGGLAFSSAASHRWLAPGTSQEVFVALTIQAEEAPEDAEEPRPGLNLALVLDRSGSMGAEGKLEGAKRAAAALVRRLEPRDHLALISYSASVETLVASRAVVEPGEFLEAINALAPGGSTDLHAGLVQGYEEILSKLDPGRMNRVLLISDGLPTAGVQNAGKIQERARRCLERGVRISTLGLGLDYDEDLLGAIALEAGGNYGYVAPRQPIEPWLARELDELANIIARDVQLRVTLGEGVQLAEVFGCRYTLAERILSLHSPDLYGGERRQIGLRLRVRGLGEEERPLFTTGLVHVASRSGERLECQGESPTLAFTEDPMKILASRDLGVLARLEVLRNARALQAAMDLQKNGEFQAAQELLAARYLNSKTLNRSEYQDPEVSRILERMKSVLLDIEATRGSPRERRDLQLGTHLDALGYLGY